MITTVTAEELQAEISPIQRFVKVVLHFDATFEVEGLVFPPTSKNVLLDRGMSVLRLCRWKVFSKKLCSRVHSIEVDFYSKQEGQHPLTGQRAPPISGGT